MRGIKNGKIGAASYHNICIDICMSSALEGGVHNGSEVVARSLARCAPSQSRQPTLGRRIGQERSCVARYGPLCPDSGAAAASGAVPPAYAAANAGTAS